MTMLPLFQRGSHVGEPGIHDQRRRRQGHRAQVWYKIFFVSIFRLIFFVLFFRIGLHQLEMLRHQLTGTLHSTKMAKVRDLSYDHLVWDYRDPDWVMIIVSDYRLSYDSCLWYTAMIESTIAWKSRSVQGFVLYKVDTIYYGAQWRLGGNNIKELPLQTL